MTLSIRDCRIGLNLTYDVYDVIHPNKVVYNYDHRISEYR